jgi:hypothetical protein
MPESISLFSTSLAGRAANEERQSNVTTLRDMLPPILSTISEHSSLLRASRMNFDADRTWSFAR